MRNLLSPHRPPLNISVHPRPPGQPAELDPSTSPAGPGQTPSPASTSSPGSPASPTSPALVTAPGTPASPGPAASPSQQAPAEPASPPDDSIVLPKKGFDIYNDAYWAFPSRVTQPAIDNLNARIASGLSDTWTTTDTWAHENGGFELGRTNLRIVLQGLDEPVEITNVRAHIVERQPIPLETLLFAPPQGETIPIRNELDLDDAEPSSPYYIDRAVTIQPNELVTIDVSADVTTSAVVWDLVFDLTVGGRNRSMTVTRPDGSHFRTTAWSDHRKSGHGLDYPLQDYTTGYTFHFSEGPQDPGFWTSCVPEDCSRGA